MNPQKELKKTLGEELLDYQVKSVATTSRLWISTKKLIWGGGAHCVKGGLYA